jgi:hypothetical protein
MGIGKIFKKIGQGIGKLAKGVMKFAQSPFGKLLINVGLSFVTGGMGGLLTKGLGILSKVGGGNLLSTFGGLASKFLGPAQSFLSKSGLGAVVDFAKKATGSSDLLSMATDIFKARQKAPQTDPTTNQIVQHNLTQTFAQRQAQTIQW